MLNLSYHTLSNGLRLVVATNHKSPVVNVTVSYRVGSKDESQQHTGLAHLFEHLMFDNIQSEDQTKFDTYLTRAGGESNAYTTYDYTLYHLSLPTTQLELGLWLESQRMSQFVIPQTALDTQINVVCEEILQTVKNRPYGNWRDLQCSVAYSADSMYGWEVLGSHDHVRGTKRGDAEQWYNRFYRPNNAVIVLSGDISAEDGLSLCEKHFASIPTTTETPTRTQFLTEQRRHGHISDTQSVPFDAVFTSYHFAGFKNDKTVAADLFSSIMSDGNSSRLYRALQHDQLIASEAGSYPDKREFSSLMTFFAFSAGSEIGAARLRDAVRKEIKRVIDDGITDDEMTKAKNKLKTALAYELQTSGGVADIVAQQTLFWNDPDRVFRLMEMYNAVTKDDVVDFVRAVCRDDNAVDVEILANKTEEPKQTEHSDSIENTLQI